MSTILTAAWKKIVPDLLTKKKIWRFIGTAVGIAVTIALLPVIVLLAMGGSMENTDGQSIDFTQYMESLSPKQQAVFEQMEADGLEIEAVLARNNLIAETVKAQVIYFSFFKDIQKHQYFFEEYCSFFKQAADDEELITLINGRYGLNIDYEEFMRSYSVICNISINRYMFANLEIKNNIDLAKWAVNSYETEWGFVPNTCGEVLSAEKYKEMKDEITEDCAVWQSRRTVDNLGLLYSYLWYSFDSRQIETDTRQTVSELFNSSAVNGAMDSMPDTAGIVLINGDTIGIYVGNNEVVYAKSVEDGVVKECVSDGAWTEWFEFSQLQYGDEKSFSNEIQFEQYDAAIKNNLDLVQWAINAHDSGWGYIYGTYGNVLTEGLLQDRAAVFGCEVTDYMDFIRQNWMGKRCADCVGLIKGYGWYDSASGEIRVGTNGMMDVGANAMFANATVKGTIDTIPEVPGLAVWHDGHIGIYIGNGEVIEAMNTLRGVTRTKLAGREWTHWLQIPYISYVEEKEKK